ENEGGIEPRKRRAAYILADIDAGESQRGRRAERVHREDAFLVPARSLRREFALGEVARRVLHRALLFAELEVHAPTPPPRLSPWRLARPCAWRTSLAPP